MPKLSDYVQNMIDRVVFPPITFTTPPQPKAKTKRQHRERIAEACAVSTYVLAGHWLVTYRGFKAVYDMANEHPKFCGRNNLAKPEEPAKIVQDGMRLAACWHVYGRPVKKERPTLLQYAQRPASRSAIIDLLMQRNPLMDELRISTAKPQWKRTLSADDLQQFSDAALESFKANPPFKVGNHRFVAKPKSLFKFSPSSERPGLWLVQPGDTLQKIAERHYGHAYFWPSIYNANLDRIGKDPDMTKPGTELILPAGHVVAREQEARLEGVVDRLTPYVGVDLAKDPRFTTVWFSTPRRDVSAFADLWKQRQPATPTPALVSAIERLRLYTDDTKLAYMSATIVAADHAEIIAMLEKDGPTEPQSFTWTKEMYEVLKPSETTMSDLLKLWHALHGAVKF